MLSTNRLPNQPVYDDSITGMDRSAPVHEDDDDRYGLLMSTLGMPGSESGRKGSMASEDLLGHGSPEARSVVDVGGHRRPRLPLFARLNRRFTGWPAGVAASCVLVALVLLINLGFTIWAVTHRKVGKGFDILYEGSRQRTESLNTWIHLAINILSTGLLASSNYCMQRLSAPTRQEVDRAHGSGKWLDIGAPSLRNLWSIQKSRVIVWGLLALSSIPLHLLYNSVIFTQLAAVNYSVIGVSEHSLTSTPVQLWPKKEGVSSHDTTSGVYVDWVQSVGWLQNHSSQLTRLELADCQRAYSTELVGNRGNALLVLTGADVPPFIASKQSYESEPFEQCDDGPRYMCYDPETSEMYFGGLGVQPGYCLSEDVEERCVLHYSRTLLGIVIACNAIKLGCLLWTLWRYNDPTLVTLGDATSSFLERPDPATKGYCMVSKGTVQDGICKMAPAARRWDHRRHFWFAASSAKRWIVCYVLSAALIVFACYMFQQGLETLYDPWWKMSLGETNVESLVRNIRPGSVMSSAVIANLPQLVISGLYLLYNAIYTCQLVAKEWSDFGQRHRRLRVTAPNGRQTSTYYLGLPYTYAIPLLFMSTFLHWLVSRSIFLVNIMQYDPPSQTGKGLEEADDNLYVSRLGYSALALLLSTITGSFMVVIGLLNGFRRYPPGIPLASTCSFAISAACHVPADELEECPDIATRPLRWGVTGMKADGVGHCSFSHRPVSQPTREGRYMGE